MRDEEDARVRKQEAAYVALIKLAELARNRLRDMVDDWNESEGENERRYVVRRDGDEPSVAILLRGCWANCRSLPRRLTGALRSIKKFPMRGEPKTKVPKVP
jgi:hypothetical protein